MILNWIVWGPPREIFTIPFVNWPIVWYGVFFALGFGFGYYIFSSLLQKFFFYHPLLGKKDVIRWDLLPSEVLRAHLPIAIDREDQEKSLDRINAFLQGPEVIEFDSKFKKFFSKFPRPNVLLKRLFLEEHLKKSILSINDKTHRIADRFTVFMILSTVLGARLGHFFFYENPSDYIHHPWELLKIWEGGLASHGAVIAITFMIFFFASWTKKFCKSLNWVTLLDFVCVPTAFAAVFIRIGNFFNQEILGSPSTLPWAIVFPHPMDGALSVVPRHPAQLYEAALYLLTFFLLLSLSKRPKVFLSKGKLIGAFFILVFSFRFFVEFIKEEQSEIVSAASSLTMGQYLSIPVVLLGVFLLFYNKIFKKKIAIATEPIEETITS